MPQNQEEYASPQLYRFDVLKLWHGKKDSKYLLSFLEKVFLSYGV